MHTTKSPRNLILIFFMEALGHRTSDPKRSKSRIWRQSVGNETFASKNIKSKSLNRLFMSRNILKVIPNILKQNDMHLQVGPYRINFSSPMKQIMNSLNIRKSRISAFAISLLMASDGHKVGGKVKSNFTDGLISFLKKTATKQLGQYFHDFWSKISEWNELSEWIELIIFYTEIE